MTCREFLFVSAGVIVAGVLSIAGLESHLLGPSDGFMTKVPPAPMGMLGRPPASGQSSASAPAPTDWSTIPADHPVERFDENSRTAHQQLLAKTKQGRIDVYFIGDSITRRWGATDYPVFLAHWRERFSGWNAGNFAWGGDRTQHMLWRLQNGELDGVRPKIFVVQAGANNIDRHPFDAGRAADLTRGIEAIVDTVRAHSPEAVIVITGVFPRGDNPGSLAGVRQANVQLARKADGRSVRFIDLTEALTDAEGRFKPGMSPDGLHFTVAAYEVWADALTPIFEEVLGPRAAVDNAPPPTGDPSAVR
jgi:lysophospholipase L1-like esterase